MNKNFQLELTNEIVTAYAANNSLSQTELMGLIGTVASTLSDIGDPQRVVETEFKAVTSVKSSIKDDHLVCLCCGKKLKTLKRHIMAVHGLSLQEYMARYNLPYSYPSVAPDYAKKRSSIALGFGFGRK